MSTAAGLTEDERDFDFPREVPVLTDGVVTLRAHELDDLDRIVEFAADPDTLRWTTIPHPYGRADARRFVFETVPAGWRSRSDLRWAIEVDGHFAGNVDLRLDGPRAGIGFGLHPAARDRGVMRRAVEMVARHAFEVLGVRVVEWRAFEGNLGSLRVAHACGFTLQARIRDGLSWHEQLRDAWVGTLRPEHLGSPQSTWRATTFSTERFRLRPLVEADDPRIRETLDDPISRRYLFGRPDPLTLADAGAERTRKWWTAACGETCTWAVADKDTDRYLGDISIFGIDDVTGAEAGFYTHPDARGSGVLREAFGAVVPHCFGELGLRRLTMFAADSNAGSKALACAAGFRVIGVQESAARTGGVFEDLVGYELLADR
ncbi:GNAT family N-acetyltransferase [Gordonia sp. ABSL1-1]|uniref:GNAT family N-acetyltransferase n=1 Tax=Gordonia sp. ABSL1-1 TaxID=3053923 RepID=UPI0025746B25|nr:GNAT family N-acetyltransferase [Gordonia sp. ABSL1-1]MDL9936733.1 GNAT family N-acetyltransferase [Gordonia sp. ABSL1-1]